MPLSGVETANSTRLKGKSTVDLAPAWPQHGILIELTWFTQIQGARSAAAVHSPRLPGLSLAQDRAGAHHVTPQLLSDKPPSDDSPLLADPTMPCPIRVVADDVRHPAPSLELGGPAIRNARPPPPQQHTRLDTTRLL
ncbi:hypothetical protein ACCO45_000128 [Purpureocillium lilacinum]|uniref:Uncharacterized protein n=1 Tax=Purpureocillium lilacinum TaxID=33203 RepID=A0ACC4E3C0_PURLI